MQRIDSHARNVRDMSETADQDTDADSTSAQPQALRAEFYGKRTTAADGDLSLTVVRFGVICQRKISP
jgi:hypothetical protein